MLCKRKGPTGSGAGQATSGYIDALSALAAELCLSVDGVTLKREFVTLVCQKLELQSLIQRMKPVVRRGGVQLLQKELSALKVFELRSIAMELGVASTGLKTELQERLSTYFSSQDILL